MILKTNPFVKIIGLDFTKAFHTIRHETLATKLATLEVPDYIFNWLINFLQNRGHFTRYALITSAYAPINVSVVQGSGFGPTAYDVGASDL